MSWHHDDPFVSTVAATSPPATPPKFLRVLFRLFIAVLIVAGVAGGLFQAYRTSRLVAKIVSHPHSAVTTTHQHRPQQSPSR
jgi:hypothetical protein